MLTVINLQVIDKIFTEDAETTLSPLAKMTYINVITHYFRDKSPTVLNAVAFDIFKNEIKDYPKYQKRFEELHRAGLVVVCDDRVSFQNVWGSKINRSLLDKPKPEEFVAGMNLNSVGHFKTELMSNKSLVELATMKYKINAQQVESLLQLFIKEQTTLAKQYTNLADCTKHFIFWIPSNISKTQQTSVKSNNKRLG